MKIDESSDYAITFEVTLPDKTVVSATFDAVDASDELKKLAFVPTGVPADEEAYLAALSAWAASKGLPGLKWVTLCRMRDAVHAHVRSLLGKGPAPSSSGQPA